MFEKCFGEVEPPATTTLEKYADQQEFGSGI